jgi:hypothetical protein
MNAGLMLANMKPFHIICDNDYDRYDHGDYDRYDHGDYDRYDYDHHRDYDRGVLRSVTTMAVTTIDRSGFDSCRHRFLVMNHPRARRG